jgi:lipopolysaccharide/colanic/teichoic acid biosynthesis glycosyltransferase
VYPEPLTTLEERGIGVLQRIAARDTLLGLSGLREVAGMPFVALRTHALPSSRVHFKRCLELAGLVVTAPVLLPLVGLTALYVRAVAGSPVLYTQQRVGRGGRPFTLVKFRTMLRDAEEKLGPILASTTDRRVIPGCRWLRATRLDELPQLWNVLRGEMSVVGPRPERPELAARYEQLIPGYARRHEIAPGLTGLAQISGRYHTDPEYKLGHDLQYLVNWSPVLDLQILARTFWVMFSRRV